MTVSLINSGLGHPGYEWSRETMEAEAELIRRAEAEVPEDFDGLCRFMGYRPNLLRNAIGRATCRKTIIARLNGAGIRFQNNDEVLADAYLAELAGQMAEAAE